MADLTITQHDTWPPLRGRATDEDGPLPLATADSLKVLLKSGSTLIEGVAQVIDPPDADGFNWSYTWAAGDTTTVGTYNTALEVTWDAGATPPAVETVPNGTLPTVEIVADLG